MNTQCIFKAAKECDLDMLERYIDSKWDFIQKDENGNTIFHLLYSNKNNDIGYWDKLFDLEKKVRYRFNKKFYDVIISSKNIDGVTPIALASKNNEKFYKEIIYFLKNINPEWRPTDRFKALINAGVDINVAIDYENSTMLHEACSDKFIGKEVVRNLIQKGAHVEARNRFGDTPLFDCSSDEKTAILVKYGKADVNAHNNFGETVALNRHTTTNPQQLIRSQLPRVNFLLMQGAWFDEFFKNTTDVTGFTMGLKTFEHSDLKPEQFPYTTSCQKTFTPLMLTDLSIIKILQTPTLELQDNIVPLVSSLKETFLGNLTHHVSRKDGIQFFKKLLLVAKAHAHDIPNIALFRQEIITDIVPRYAEQKTSFKIDAMLPFAAPYSKSELIQLRKEGIMEELGQLDLQ